MRGWLVKTSLLVTLLGIFYDNGHQGQVSSTKLCYSVLGVVIEKLHNYQILIPARTEFLTVCVQLFLCGKSHMTRMASLVEMVFVTVCAE